MTIVATIGLFLCYRSRGSVRSCSACQDSSTSEQEQSGYTAGHSTRDAILALRQLAELHRAFNRPLHVAYIDVKSAFESVDRSALWKVLQAEGMPLSLLHL